MGLFYNTFSTLAFGSHLTLAKKRFIKYLKPGSVVLMIGKGNGTILNDILTEVDDLEIDYIEKSPAILSAVKKKLDPRYAHQVHFIQGNHKDIPMHTQYDGVITFFIFNAFKQHAATRFAKAVNASLKPSGTWLFADFFSSSSRIYNQFLHRIMYAAFMLFTGTVAFKQPSYNSIFRYLRYTLVDEKMYCNGFIRSRVYKKEQVKNGK